MSVFVVQLGVGRINWYSVLSLVGNEFFNNSNYSFNETQGTNEYLTHPDVLLYIHFLYGQSYFT